VSIISKTHKFIFSLLTVSLLSVVAAIPTAMAGSFNLTMSVCKPNSKSLNCSSTNDRIVFSSKDIRCVQPDVSIDHQKYYRNFSPLDPQKRNPDYGKTQYRFNFALTTEAGQRLKAFTSKHVGSLMQLSLNGEVLSRARVGSPLGKDFQIMQLSKQKLAMLKKAFGSHLLCHSREKHIP
jgi:preprotein translocase subunit SecD